MYFESIIDSQCIHYTIPHERSNAFIADHILRKYDDRQNHDPNLRGRCDVFLDTSKGKRHHDTLVTYAIIDESSDLLHIAGLLCARAFQRAVLADISVPGKNSVIPIPYFTERNMTGQNSL